MRLALRSKRHYHGRLTWHATFVGLFVLLVAGGIGFPVPEDLTLLGAGVLAHERILGLRTVIAVGFLGVVVADWIIYLVGRRYGGAIVKNPFLARLFGASRVDAVRQAVERHGARAVFAARFVLGFRIATFFAAGSFRVPVIRFAIAEAAASAIFVPAMVTLGFLFSHQVDRVARNATRVQHWVLLAGLVGLALYLALRAWVGRTGLGGEGPEASKRETSDDSSRRGR